MLHILRKIKTNQHTKSIIVIILIIGVVIGSYFGTQLALNNPVPFRVVESGSMSLTLNFITGPPYSFEDFLLTLEHPFDRTLDTGDIIIIQKVDPKDLNTNYPYSDIIVYQKPNSPSDTPIVHRIVGVDNINGTLYFQTKGDGNNQKWPLVPPSSMYDSNTIYNGGGHGVPQNLVEGKVIMRIPLLGWVTLLMRSTSWVLPLIIVIIMLLVFLEFVIPFVKERRKPVCKSSEKLT